MVILVDILLKALFNNVEFEMHGPTCSVSVIWCNIEALKKLRFKMIIKCLKKVKSLSDWFY